MIEELESEGARVGAQKVDYILGMRLRKSKEVSDKVLGRAGRYHKVADTLWVKEVWVNGRRYVVCYNPEEEEHDRKRWGEIIERTRDDLNKKGAKAFVIPRGLRRFVELVGGELVIKEAAIREEARYDGKWVLRTSTDLSAAEVALAYISLWQVEHDFRELKSGLEVRPVFLRTEDHVCGHLVVCFLALVLETSLARLLKPHGSSGSYQEVLADLEQMRAVCFESRGKSWLWSTELTGQAFHAFRAVGMRPPARVQPLT